MKTNLSADPRGTIRRRKACSLRRRDGLIRYGFDRTSQSGEDGIIERLFELIPSLSNDGSEHGCERWCVDVGAWDGRHLSNTYSLLVQEDGADMKTKSSPSQLDGVGGDRKESKRCRWRGVLIEADADKCVALKSLHEALGNACIQCAVSCRADSSDSLRSILSMQSPNELPSNFDFLCIDVDGADYWLMHDLLQDPCAQTCACEETGAGEEKRRVFRPKVICIEFNPTIPHDVIFVQPRDDSIRQGSSLAALAELASHHGYTLVETTCYNAFFVDGPVFEQHVRNDIPFDSTVIEHVHELTMGTSLFQLYDGTLKLAGCKKLLWHRLPILESNIQVLDPTQHRAFPFAPNNAHEPTKECTDRKAAKARGNDRGKKKSSNNNRKRHTNGGRQTVNDKSTSTVYPSVEYQDMTEEDQKDMSVLHDNAIDMSSYCNASEQTKEQSAPGRQRECSEAIVDRLEQDGFALIRGTGMEPAVCTDALRRTHDFLQSASEDVRRSSISKEDRARRGYSPPNSENFASLVGETGPNDLVRKFRLGPRHDGGTHSAAGIDGGRVSDSADVEDPKDTNEDKSNSSGGDEISSSTRGREEDNSELKTKSSLHKPNTWPSAETWGHDNANAFETSIQTYYDQMCHVAHTVLAAICDGIIARSNNGPDADQLSSSLASITKFSSEPQCSSSSSSSPSSHTSILTLLGYRTGKRHRGKCTRPLVAAHTDVGAITILLFDGGDSAVLQRATQNKYNDHLLSETPPRVTDGWLDVSLPRCVPLDPIFIVNIGDCLSDLSGGILPSTLHRVMPCHGSLPRNCLAFFVGLHSDQKLILPNTGETLRYEEWRRHRIDRATAVLHT